MADITETIQNMFGGGGGGVTGFFMNVNFDPVFSIIKVVLYFACVAAAFLLFYKYFVQYKVYITVQSRFGGGLKTKMDRAKVIVDEQGKRKLVLFKTRFGKHGLTCPLPEAKYKTIMKGKDHYFLWLDDNQQLHPIDSVFSEGPNVDNVPQLKIMPQERAAWGRNERRITEAKYKKKDKMEQYLPLGVVALACICAFLIMFFGFKEIGNGLVQLSQQFAQVASNCISKG